MPDTQKKNAFQVFLNGLITENPTFVLMLGMCPTLGVTTAAMTGIGMGLAPKAYLPDLSDALGVYIPLIVVNCIIFARAEAFAFKNGPVASLADGLGMGLGFTCAITILSAIRELLGSGTIFGAQLMPESYEPMAIMLQVPGGFITLGLLLILVNAIRKGLARRKEMKAKEELG